MASVTFLQPLGRVFKRKQRQRLLFTLKLAQRSYGGIIGRMRGVKSTRPYIVDTNFINFNKEYGSCEARRQHALSLIPGNGLPPRPNNYPSRSVLSTRWAEDRESLFYFAKKLYDLTHTATNNSGRTVIGFVTGEADDIERGEVPDNGITVEVNKLDHNGIDYGFRRTPARLVPTEYADARFVDFQTGLSTVASQTLSLRPDGQFRVDPLISAKHGSVAYSGTSCLEEDRQIYQETQLLSEHSLVFGSRNGFRLIEKLVDMAGSEPRERFRNMVAEGAISPLLPLPDLESLAA